MTDDRPPWEPPAAADAPPLASPPAEVASMGFEQALAELEQIVQDLERGQLDLEAAIRAYERGTALKQHCEQKLKEAQLRVERITVGDGGPGLTPFERE